jgi:hypothetical protein
MPSDASQILIEVIERIAQLDLQVTQDAATVAALYRTLVASRPELVYSFEQERNAAKTQIEHRTRDSPLHAYADIIQRLKEM